MPACCGSASGSRSWRRCCWRSCRACRPPRRRAVSASSSGGVRITSGTNRRLRIFAVTQIAASFVLLAGAGMLLTTLFALQAARDDVPDAQRAGAARAGHVVRPDAGPGHRLLPGSDAAHLRAARRRARRGGHAGAVARGRRLRARLPAHRRGARPRGRRRRSAGAVPHGLAGLLRRARRAAARRPRLQRRRSARQRARRDHQPEPGAAAVPEQGRRQPLPDVDRPGHAVHRHEHRQPADRRRRRRHRRRERRAGAGDERLSPAGTGVRRRPPVRPHPDRSVSAGRRRSRASSGSCRPSSRSNRRRRSTT